MKRGFVEIPAGQVHYRTDGHGKPLLLLHQTPMSSAEYEAVIPILAQKYRAIAMDTLGYGDSDRAPHPYRIEDYARSVIEFLDALHIARTNVAGHHTGALIAAELAAAYPERVIKVILSGIMLLKQPEEGQARLNDPRFQPPVLSADGSYVKEVWARAMERFPETRLDLTLAWVVDYLKAGLTVHDARRRAAFAYDGYNRLPFVKIPTLLVVGDKDVLYEHTAIAERLIPGSKVAVIKGATANVLRLRPREWAETVLAFLAGSQ